MSGDDLEFKINTKNHQLVNNCIETEGQWKEPFFFIQGADTQYGMIATYEEPEPKDDWSEEIALSEKLVNAINNMNPLPKFFVICGDLLNAWPDITPDVRAKQEIDFKKVFAKVDSRIPLICVCGNHDIGNTPSQETISKYRTSFGDDYFSFWSGGVFFIVINSQYYFDPSKVKELEDEHEKWLDEQLKIGKESNCKHTVILQHIPWFLNHVDETDHPVFTIKLETRKRMLEKLKNAGIKYIFCGHYHRNAGGFYGDMEVIVTSAIGKQLGNDPNGVRIVKVYENSINHKYIGIDDLPQNVEL